jgi:molybdate transport system ATP-binding protein
MIIVLSKSLQGRGSNMQLNIEMEIPEGKRIALYGPSGAGKTSTLKMISGLVKPDKGMIRLGNDTWYDSERKINQRPQLRSIGVVFQEYALFPHMTIRQNLTYALPDGQPDTIVDELLNLTELKDLSDRKPRFLSGGQQQRVALARALVRRPKILLLDEPLSALDTTMRFRLQEYLLEIHQRFNFTMILVSHDMLEVVRLAEEVYILNEGSIKGRGKPSEVLPIDQLKNMIDHL